MRSAPASTVSKEPALDDLLESRVFLRQRGERLVEGQQLYHRWFVAGRILLEGDVDSSASAFRGPATPCVVGQDVANDSGNKSEDVSLSSGVCVFVCVCVCVCV